MEKLLEGLKIERETEKAYLLKDKFLMGCEYRASAYAGLEYNPVYKSVWLPKSQVVVENDTVVEVASWLVSQYGFDTVERANAKEEAFDKYEKLIEWAKTQGVAVRKRMKKSTIINMIENANLLVPAELI